MQSMRVIAVILIGLLVTACKVDLYSNLSEREANHMLAILLSQDISASKVVLDDTVTLQVEEGDLLRAIDVLNNTGYPRTSRDSLGKVFEKTGIMSSPFEERIRFVYALGEEVSKTLSEIDGVLTARVHIVLPDKPELGEEIKPSSAAVFIKHRPGVDLEYFSPQIKRLVSNSIEGVDYANVTVVLVEAIQSRLVTKKAESETTGVMPGLNIKNSDVSFFWQIVIAASVAMLVLLVLCIVAFVALLRARRGQQPEPEPVPAE